MGSGRWGRLAAALVAIAALVLLGAPPASAHTELVRSDPPNGGMVAEGRTELSLWFDEAVGASFSNVEVRTLGGQVVTSDFEISDDGHRMVIHTTALERGSYVIDWHAFSMVDGHASTGQVIFGSGLRPDVVATGGETAPTELVVARWLDLAALLVALGAVSVGGRVLRAAGPGGSVIRRRVRRYAAYAAIAACYTGVLLAFLRTRAAGAPLQAWVDQTWLSLTSSAWGNLWLAREAMLVVAAVALWRWRRSDADPERRVAAAALAGAVLVEGFAGHAAALPEQSVVAALMAAGHVLAAGVWVGGLAVLATTVLRVFRRGSADPAARPDSGVWRAYSPRAAVASAVLVATGLYEAGRHLPTVDSFTSTLYGRAVLLKMLLVVAALAVAGFNTLLVNPDLAARWPAVRARLPQGDDVRRTFWRTVSLEAIVLVVAVLAAGVLTSVPTSREIAVATRPAVPHVENVDGMFVTVEAVPSGEGQRRIVVRAVPTVLPAVAPIVAVEADVVAPDQQTTTVPLEQIDEGRYEGSLPTETPGRWSTTLRLHRQAHPDTVVSTTWQQSATPDQLPHTLRTLTGLAALLILFALVVAGFTLRRRRTPPGDPARPHPTLERIGS
ncbi:copper resistance CopC/CopD family protein [Nocardioides sp.]|uniref:copper resistance CopC/CopD family protein n=1 Tax=Nocardioides sp. TaxID=35761 RepID=UPI0035289695